MNEGEQAPTQERAGSVTKSGGRWQVRTPAERSARYRERKRQRLADLDKLKDALADACEAARCHKLMRRLPDDPGEWVPILTERLAPIKLVVCRRESRKTRLRAQEGQDRMNVVQLDPKALGAARNVSRQLQRTIEDHAAEADRIRSRQRLRPDASRDDQHAAAAAVRNELQALTNRTGEAVTALQAQAEAVTAPLVDAAGRGAATALFRPEPTDTSAALLRELRQQRAWGRWAPVLTEAASEGRRGIVAGEPVVHAPSPGNVLQLAGEALGEALDSGDEDSAEALLREVPFLVRSRFGPEAGEEAETQLRRTFLRHRPEAAVKVKAFESVGEGARRLRSNFLVVKHALKHGEDAVSLHSFDGGEPVHVTLGSAQQARAAREMARSF